MTEQQTQALLEYIGIVAGMTIRTSMVAIAAYGGRDESLEKLLVMLGDSGKRLAEAFGLAPPEFVSEP
jgi:ABC-type cobalt transport system substrate-binding protein